MTREHIPLPGLRVMATAFFLARMAEGAETYKNYCAGLDNKVVDFKNCDGKQPENTFFMFASDDQNIPVGTVIDPMHVDLFDSSDPVERQNVLLPLEIEAGGFGKRQDCGTTGGGGSTGGRGGRGGTVIVGGGVIVGG
ncbi:hypothetical protein CGCSCA4_v005702 [Colletotrichum siamense]|uniref:Uncharacterized protein n=1 Tax=Colletotrichum siamense TaxID=690259 RepID=A0A9P5BKY7_COLSI|nr:hypothetical protein CGCSCA2_v014843 [Colletotrichum siamense]KAF4847245.1 hypothetical protein CGCSCA4_v005702 [Colletotrichum siamense]